MAKRREKGSVVKVLHPSLIYLGIVTFCIGFVVLMKNWDTAAMEYRCAYLLLMGVSLHSVEEYRFPGGFIYMMNVQLSSPDAENLERYPGNKLSSFIGNLLLMITVFLVMVWFMNPVTAAGTAIFGLVEIFFHTFAGGISSYMMFRDRGKETIYTPGCITAWFIFLPCAIGILYGLISSGIMKPLWWAAAVIGALVVALGFIILPALFLINKDSPYGFDKRHFKGYYAKFDDARVK